MKADSFFLFLLGLFLLCVPAHAQDDIKFTPVFTSSDVDATDGTINLLKNKFKSQAIKNHYFSREVSRFLLVINPNKSEVQYTGDQLIAKYSIQIELYDQMADQTFHSFDFTLAGIGRTEAQAFAHAISKLNLRNRSFSKEMDLGVEALVSYYEKNCERLLDKVDLLKNAEQYPAAFAQLYIVPNVGNGSCLQRYNQQFESLWKAYNIHQCENLISEANLLWASNPTTEGARDVAYLLQGLNLNGRCQSSFNQLMKEIKAKLIDDQFDERAFRDLIATGTFEVEKNKINAIRDISSAYFNSLVSDTYIILD